MTKRGALLLIVLVFTASCQKYAEGQQMFRQLLALRDQIAMEFHEKVVDVSIANTDQMSIKFIDSPLNSRTREEKQQRADAVAAFVAKHYNQPLSSVSVRYASSTSSGGETYTGKTATH